MSAPVDVLVAGGGATATATALAAAACGLSVRHLQGAGVVRGRRYALSRRSVRFLQRLKACPPLLPVAGFHLYVGGRWQSVSAAAPLCYMAEEGALAEALADALALRAVHTTRTEEALHLQGVDEESIAVCIGGADGERVQARLLAVADGAASPLAAQLGITAAVHDFKQQALVAQVTAPSLRADVAYQWFAQNDIVALLPAGAGAFSLVWSTASASALAAVQEGGEAVAAVLAQRTGLAHLHISGAVNAFPLRAQVRAVRVAQRAALLGDAAGVVHPLAGQGLNLGLADAEELLRCTARRLCGEVALGLAAYSQVRSRRQWQLQGITRALLNERVAAGVLGLSRLPALRQAAVVFANA